MIGKHADCADLKELMGHSGNNTRSFNIKKDMLIWMDHVTAYVDGSAALTTTTVKRRNSLPKYGMCTARPLHEPLTQHGPPFQFFNFAPVPA